MKKHILPLIAAALLLSGCGSDISSTDSSSTPESTKSSNSSQESTPESGSSEQPEQQPEAYEYTDTKTDPFEIDKNGVPEGGVDYDTFSHTEDIAKSVWGAFYEQKYGADKSKLIPKVPEGYQDMGGAANMESISFGISDGGGRTFSVKIDLAEKYGDIQALYNSISADTTVIERDGAEISGDTVIEHFTESIYFEYTVNILTPDGFRAEVSSISKDTGLDELTGFALSLTF